MTTIKTIFLVCILLFPFMTKVQAYNAEEMTAIYQDLCAKEQDPVKRHNYCYLLENNDRRHHAVNVFRQDRVIV